MGLRINHNIPSLNAFRNLSVTDTRISKSLERLSSGLKINRASDDPAGLAISQQFRAQISGLNQAIENSETAISMVQTAEAALTEVHNLLTTMRELAVHAANEAVNDETMLRADQQQIESSIDTINRIAQTTQFGKKTLLDGSKDNIVAITNNVSDIEYIGNSTLSEGTHTITVASVIPQSQYLNNLSLGLSQPTSIVGLDPGDHIINITRASGAASYDGSTLSISTTSPITITNENDRFFFSLDGSDAMAVTISAAAYTNITTLMNELEDALETALTANGIATTEISVSAVDGEHLRIETTDEGSSAFITISDTGITDSVLKDLGFTPNTVLGEDAVVIFDNQENTVFDVDDTTITYVTLQDKDGNSFRLTVDNAANGVIVGTSVLTINATSFLVNLDGGAQKRFESQNTDTLSNGTDSIRIMFGDDVAEGTNMLVAKDNALYFQVGPNQGQRVRIGLASMSAAMLGTTEYKLSEIDVKTKDGADRAIGIVDAAIDRVSEERAELGAFQLNTLESNLANLRVAFENVNAAESIIRDANMAEEMANFTRNQILQQAGVAMLAQANMIPQAVLQLLQ